MSVNAEAIEAWNTVIFDKFYAFRDLLAIAFSPHGDAAHARLAPRPGERLLDIGCGFGDTTIPLAAAVQPGGEVVGVDAAARFIELARAEADKARTPGVRFEVADAQGGALGGPYDGAFARFGTMFFDSPVAAMRNVRRSVKDGGRLSIVVWRRREDNEWVHEAEMVVRDMVQLPPEPEGLTCGPGPFSMAGADTVSSQLQAAGWTRVSFERFDMPICIGRSIDEALAFALALGPAGEIIRLAGDAGERQRPTIEAALRAVLTRFAGADGRVVAPSSTWIITARAG
jgi:SAM-dependent methyltransferase